MPNTKQRQHVALTLHPAWLSLSRSRAAQGGRNLVCRANQLNTFVFCGPRVNMRVFLRTLLVMEVK